MITTNVKSAIRMRQFEHLYLDKCLRDLGDSAEHCSRIKEQDRSSKSNPRAHHLLEENPALNSIGEQTTHGDQSRSQTTNLLI